MLQNLNRHLHQRALLVPAYEAVETRTAKIVYTIHFQARLVITVFGYVLENEKGQKGTVSFRI